VSVHRIMGLETEYGISVPGQPMLNAMVTSSQIVNAYAYLISHGTTSKARWDYDEESPLRDARGFDMSRSEADASQLTDEDLGLANVILPNGARLYVDHAHPEYSTPEVTNPRDAVLWDRAGVNVMNAAADAAAASPGGERILLYKNNTDNKGASYGCHENYLMRRTTPFADVVRHLTPFFISRQVFTGAGRLGIGQEGQTSAFQLSQRADFFEVEVGLETTLKRPIINTRDEPHADPEKYRRLHVIVGDANMSDTATFLKMGTTAIVLAMIEDGYLDTFDAMPVDPVREMHQVSHDTTLTHVIDVSRGRRWTAIDMQRAFLENAWNYCQSRSDADFDEQTKEVLTLWGDHLDRLDNDRMSVASTIDWVAKLSLLEGYVRRDGLAWDDPRLHLVDLQYADIRSDKGLAARLEQRGRLVRMFDDEEIDRARQQPPHDTRAYFRGECVRRYPESIAAASWDSVVFDIPQRESLLRVPTLEPTRGTHGHVSHILDASPDAASLIDALTDD